jgi:hypothetical protein
MRVPIGVVKEGERNPEHWISVSGSSPTSIRLEKLAIDSDRNIYVSGYYGNFVNGFLLKSDKFGAIQYSSRTQHPNWQAQQSIADINVDYSNAVYNVSWVTYSVPGPPEQPWASYGVSQAYFTKHNTSLQPQFSKRIILSPALLVFGRLDYIYTDPQNNVYVTGETYPDYNASPSNERYLAKFNSSGSLLWQRRFGDNAPSNDFGKEYYGFGQPPITDSLGNVYSFFFANMPSTSGQGTVVLLKYDASGNFQWKKRLDSSVELNYLSTSGLIVDSQNNVYIGINDVTPSQSITAVVMKIDSAGNIQWQKSLVGGSITSMVMSSDYNIYIAQNNTVSRFDLSLNPIYQFGINEASSLRIKHASNGTIYLVGARDSSVLSQYNNIQLSIPENGEIYGSYLVGQVPVVISKNQTQVPTSANLVETALSTTSAVSSVTVEDIQNDQATNLAVSSYRIVP